MGVMRSLLLAASESRWLRQKAPRLGFVKAAVRRFMPGERVEDAMAAAADLARQNTTAVLTRLGENVTDRREADAVTEHYLDVLQRIASSGLDVEISVKLTQLGLDIDVERCYANLRRLLQRAQGSGGFVWIDMEQFAYVDRTLAIYRRALAEFPCTGVCLQAYLYRTPDDLTALMPLGGAVRLVKGAYLEPATVAHPKKGDVDAAYRELGTRMLTAPERHEDFRAVFGTHDTTLIRDLAARAAAAGVSKKRYEFALLYGIQRGEQQRLAREGDPVRVLVAYGDYWFPWYMRRLAERPANVWFVARSMFQR
jgi:proline dehydrogenase